MSEFWNTVVWLLLIIRDQCMPVVVGDTPGAIDYAVVALAAVGMVGGTVWFVWGLMGRDSARHHAIKTQVLED